MVLGLENTLLASDIGTRAGSPALQALAGFVAFANGHRQELIVIAILTLPFVYQVCYRALRQRDFVGTAALGSLTPFTIVPKYSLRFLEKRKKS